MTELQQHLVQVLRPVAVKYDLTLNAFGRVVHAGQAGQVSISEEYDSALEPSPVTPTGYGPYSILAGTIKATVESSNFYNVSQVVVSPSLSLGSHLPCSSSYSRLIHSCRQYWCDLFGCFVPSHAGLTFRLPRHKILLEPVEAHIPVCSLYFCRFLQRYPHGERR